jgi:alkylation response protein AidB-like acyl-CoA dehydrogenase
MTDTFKPPLADIDAAFGVVGIYEVLGLHAFAGLDRDSVDDVLATFAVFVGQEIAPLNRSGDREGSVLTASGVVRTPAGFKEAYRRYVGAGWPAAAVASIAGGGGLPKLVATAMEELLTGANLAFSLCPMLTHGAVELLTRWGSASQKAHYLPRLVTGEWTGTMCLTEPDAGSDVGAIHTSAVQRDGCWHVTGTKIFITWGDHDLADNIVHLVLARTPGAPVGTKGLSLFLVPARHGGHDGPLGPRNAVRVVSLEQKLGIHASPTCVLSFEDAEAELVGDVHQGMAAMFTMMNSARLAVGVEGLGLAERAFQSAAAYAIEREQGTRPGRERPHPVAIIEHPDVRRMLLRMRARIDASRLLIYRTAAALDVADHGTAAEDRNGAAALAALLVPLAKAWPTNVVNEVTSNAIQVFGGAGFIEDSGIAQLYRDARITSIYEGTNGIQAIDLVFRKLDLSPEGALHRLLNEVTEAAASLLERDDGPMLSKVLCASVDVLVDATRTLVRARQTDCDWALAVATPFLEAAAVVIGGGLLARQLIADGSAGDDSDVHRRRREAAAVFHLSHLVPEAMTTLATLDAVARSVRMFDTSRS